MISIQNLSYAIKGTKILSRFSLEVQEQEKYLIQGRSGTGKTSLFRLMLGFDQPSSGKITIKGLFVDSLHIRQVRQSIFYLSQDIDLADKTAMAILTSILKFNNCLPRLGTHLEGCLDLLSLSPHLLDKKVSQLSGGERQRVGLLIGFLLDRPIWLLDEPTSALDDAMKEQIVGHILALDKTLLVISHDKVWKNRPELPTINWE